jgi:hypothetical protein
MCGDSSDGPYDPAIWADIAPVPPPPVMGHRHPTSAASLAARRVLVEKRKMLRAMGPLEEFRSERYSDMPA